MYSLPKKPSPLSQSTPQRQSPLGRPSSPMGSSPATVRPSASPRDGSTAAQRHAGGDPFSRLPPAQLREMRESFQTLDRDNDGQVRREDVQEMLNQLGQDSSAAALAPYFASGASMNLATYLNSFAAALAPLSRPDELAAAFAAFDVDDSGQVDVAELREALLHSVPEHGGRALSERDINTVLGDFSGRRAFKRGMGNGASKRGDVFRYEEFVSSMSGGGASQAEVENGAPA